MREGLKEKELKRASLIYMLEELLSALDQGIDVHSNCKISLNYDTYNNYGQNHVIPKSEDYSMVLSWTKYIQGRR